MDDGSIGLEESGRATYACDIIPSTHRDLPMLRLFLPFREPSLDETENIVRWSRYVSVEDQSASLDWFEATAGMAQEQPSIRGLVSCMGELDEETANALRDAIGSIKLQYLRWMGYAEAPRTNSPGRVFGDEYFEAHVSFDDAMAGRRVPEFAWDAERRLAWGGRLYPDSLIVAAEPFLFRQLMDDLRLDTVPVRADRDLLPRSAGD